jgi:hypothetical protein
MAAHLCDTGANVEVTIVPDAGHQVLDANKDLHDQLLRFTQQIAGANLGAQKGR